MKKIIFMLLATTAIMFVWSSTPVMSQFPEKYETWINNDHSESRDIEFDFHNFETSFTERVCGFDKNCNGSWYSYKISKHIVNNRNLLNTSVPFVFNFIGISNGKSKKMLRNSIKTFKILYDDKTLELESVVCITNYNVKRNYSAINFLGYIDKEMFLKLTKSESLILQFEIADEEFKFDLQIPRVYEDTFR